MHFRDGFAVAQVALLQGFFAAKELEQLLRAERIAGDWFHSVFTVHSCIVNTKKDETGKKHATDPSRRTPAFVVNSALRAYLVSGFERIAAALGCYVLSLTLIMGAKEIQVSMLNS